MPIGVFAIVAAWVGMALGFGIWMVVWPKHYWKTWKNYLKRGDPFEGAFPGRTDYLKAYVRRPNPNRRARTLGTFFIAAGLGVIALLVFGILPLR